MKHNFKTPHLLLALAFTVGVISLTPAGGGEFSKASLTRGLLAEENTTTDSTYTEPTNTTAQPADNYNQQPMQPYNDYGTSGGGGGGNGCAPGTTCDNSGGGMSNPTPSDKDCQFDKRDAHRMYNEISQLIKRKTKEGADTTDLNSLLTTVSAAKTKLESCTSLTWEELQTVRQTLMGDGGSGGANATLSQYRCWDDYVRQTKDYERMKKDFEKTKKDLEKMNGGDMSNEINAQVKRMNKMLELNTKKLSLMKDNNCNIWNGYSDAQMEFEDLNWEMDELRIEMDEFWPKFEQVRNTAWAEQMFTQVETDIAKGKEDYANMTPEMQKKFDTVAQVATDLVAKGRACLSAGDVQCVKEVQMKIEELGRKANQVFGGPKVDFEQMGFDKSMNTKFEQVMGDKGFGEATQIVKYLIELDPTILDKIMDPSMADKIFKVMGKMPEKMRTEYMSGQSELKDTLEEAIEAAPQLNAYKNDILGANLMGNTLTEAVTVLKDVRDGSVQATEFIQNLEQYKTESRSQEVELGVSKFGDATSDTWYYDAAHDDTLNISGKTINGEQVFDPSGQTTFAEMLKVIDEATGIGQSNGTSYGAAQGHWSAGYYGAVEDKGITFMNPDQKITRGEMARMIVEITGLPMQDVQSPFTDLSGNKYESYIKTLYANGVMNGNPDGTVKPNDSINRAEAFTLVKNMIDNLGLMAVDVQAIQAIQTTSVEVKTEETNKVDNKVKNTSDELFDMMEW